MKTARQVAAAQRGDAGRPQPDQQRQRGGGGAGSEAPAGARIRLRLEEDLERGGGREAQRQAARAGRGGGGGGGGGRRGGGGGPARRRWPPAARPAAAACRWRSGVRSTSRRANPSWHRRGSGARRRPRGTAPGCACREWRERREGWLLWDRWERN